MKRTQPKQDRFNRLAALFSSNSDEWATPLDLFNELDREFDFDVDACALPHNTKCSRYFSPEQDGLVQPWHGTVWMNPPYGRQIAAWVKKAAESAKAGATVVCLLPARTDCAWWHDYVSNATEVRFLRGRVRFVGAQSGAPFPSVIVIFRPGGSALTGPRRRWQTAKFSDLPSFSQN